MGLQNEQRIRLKGFLDDSQNRLLQRLEAIDGQAKAQRKSWDRPEGGGGTMGVIRGNVIEKAGVNVSQVSGPAYPAIEGEHQGKPFTAAGLSTITHSMNPHAPIAHMNVRLLEVGDTFWVGGGADLTPFIRYEEDISAFHQAMERACRAWAADCYPKFRAWCDEYFYIPHRQSVRGAGGIFFDYLKGDFEKSFAFLTAVVEAYLDVYPRILERRVAMPWNDDEKDGQLYWRGRYAEFNLVVDRGTKFGLMTGGNVEAIFVSLPPVVKW